MTEIRQSGRIIGLEKIAVMAALNLAHDLLAQHANKEETLNRWEEKLSAMQTKLEQALQNNKPSVKARAVAEETEIVS